MCFDVTILGDMEPENQERFILQVIYDTDGPLEAAIVTIVDDDDDGTKILYIFNR